MPSPYKAFWDRSMNVLREQTVRIVRADPMGNRDAVLPMYALRSLEDLRGLAIGSDADLGGKSTVNLDLGPEGKGRFWGKLSSELNPGRHKEGVVERGGYAGFRNKQRTSLFGTLSWDTSQHDFLRLRVKSSGDDMRYFVNIQTDGPVRSDLFQHRLWLPQPKSDDSPHEWTDVIIPLSDFTLTNSGMLSEKQMTMMRNAIRTVGISVLGPKEGRYELGIESVDAVTAEVAREHVDRNLPPQKDVNGQPL